MASDEPVTLGGGHHHQMHAVVEQFSLGEAESGDDEACTQGDAKRCKHHYVVGTGAMGVSMSSRECTVGKRSSDEGTGERPLKIRRPG